MTKSSRAVVGQLCKELGYGGSKDAKSRSASAFGSITISFRRAFQRKSPELLIFDPNSRASRECAEEFVEKNRNLFPESLEAKIQKWPTLPQHKDELVQSLPLLT